MGAPPDENLPEVVPEQAPQALDSQEAFYHQDQLNDKAPKYLAIYDDAPKYMAPEHAGDEHAPYVSPTDTMTAHSIMSPTDTIPWEPNSAYDDLNAGERSPNDEKAQERTICGLRRNVFLLLLGLAVLVIGGSVGGGVGGGITAANNRAAAAAAADAQKAQNPAGNGGLSPTPGNTTGSAPSPEPSSLNNQTQVQRTWSFQGWTGTNFTGNRTRVYWGDDENKFRDMPFEIASYVWLRNITGCCITFCSNLTTEGGWRYEDWKREKASGKFNRVFVGCLAGMHGQMSCSQEGTPIPKSNTDGND